MNGLITRKRIILGFEFLFNFILPWAFYRLTKSHVGEIHAIMASAIPPTVWSLAQFIRSRRIDAISVLVLTGIGLSLLGFSIGGSPKLLLMRESLVTGLIGVAFIGSAINHRETGLRLRYTRNPGLGMGASDADQRD